MKKSIFLLVSFILAIVAQTQPVERENVVIEIGVATW
jgi:hypothetical protein